MSNFSLCPNAGISYLIKIGNVVSEKKSFKDVDRQWKRDLFAKVT